MATKKIKTIASQLGFGGADMNRQVYFQPGLDALPHVDWKTPTAQEMPSWADAKRVSIDVECRDEDIKSLGPGCRRDPKKNYVCGIAFAIEDGPDWYLPIRHEGGDNCDWDVWGYIDAQLRDFRGDIVGNGLGYDYDWIANDVPRILTKPCKDIQVLDVLLDENQDRYNLNAICEREGLPQKDEALLRQAASVYRVDPKSGLWRMRGRYVAQYGRTDARRPLQCLRRQEKRIAEEEIENIWAIEQKLTPILVKMRRRGVRIDPQKLEQIQRKSEAIVREEFDKVHHATGFRIHPQDVWRTEALAPVLKHFGIDLPKTAKNKDSVDKNVLRNAGEVGEWILRAREWAKLQQNVAQMRRYAVVHADGEWTIHPTFNQMKSSSEDGDGGKGVRYGRYSAVDPSVQNQPVRHEEYGNLWRSVFIPRRGKKWACLDWSQQEPRIAVHYAEILDKKSGGKICPGGSAFAAEYRANPRLDIHSRLAEISNIKRKIVKNHVNGRLYGMGDLKMCLKLEQPTIRKTRKWKGEWVEMDVPGPEGQAMIDEFNKYAPWIRDLCKEAGRAAESRGFVRTRAGRKCRFVKGPDGKYYKSYKAFNRIGQGEGADMAKQVTIAADEAGIELELTVHDEFDFSYDDIAVPLKMREIMLHTVEYNVPMNVDLEVGDSWGTCEALAA